MKYTMVNNCGWVFYDASVNEDNCEKMFCDTLINENHIENPVYKTKTHDCLQRLRAYFEEKPPP